MIGSSFSPSFYYTATIYIGQGSELIGSCFSGEFVFWGHSLIAGQFSLQFLGPGTGLSQPDRPAFSLNMVVSSFISTFANCSMSASVSSPSVFSLQNSATRDVADRSAELTSPLLDQPFIVGPGSS